MADISGFDASTVEKVAGFVIPAGEYEVVIVDSKMDLTKKGDGKVLKLTLQIVSGPEQNKKLFDRINWQNPSKVCEAIGKESLASICKSVGVSTPKNTEELHMKPLRAKVVVINDPQYGMKNEIKGYSPRSGAVAPMSNPLAVAPAQTAGKTAPW